MASTGARDGEGGRRTPPEGQALRGTHFALAHFKKGGCSLVELLKGGFLPGELKDAGFVLVDFKGAGFSLKDVVSAGIFSGSDIAGAFGLRKLERKDDSERRVGARVLCEGKLGKITQLSGNDNNWNLMKIKYDDGTKNKAMGGGGYLIFTERPGDCYPPEDVWVGFP